MRGRAIFLDSFFSFFRSSYFPFLFFPRCQKDEKGAIIQFANRGSGRTSNKGGKNSFLADQQIGTKKVFATISSRRINFCENIHSIKKPCEEQEKISFLQALANSMSKNILPKLSLFTAKYRSIFSFFPVCLFGF